MGASASPAPSPAPESPRDLFSESLVGGSEKSRQGKGLPVSIVGHLLIGSAIILVPVLWTSELPPVAAGTNVFLVDFAPPPAPLLSRGSDVAKPKQEATTPEEKKPEKPKEDELRFVVPKEPEIQPEQKLPASEQQGSVEGHDQGVPEGLIDGDPQGVPGGVPGGKVGGVLGGTGDAVQDYDRPPRILRQPRPVYPTEAAVKRIEGMVVVEMLVDVNGRVLRARVVESIPLLDQAALQNVHTWEFVPASKGGVPVKSIVYGEVKFRLL
jgi:periplasmic protein TonB